MPKTIAIFLIGLLFCLFGAQKIRAQENINLDVLINSKVSKLNCTVTTNGNETLADPSTHWILLTVILRDSSNNPLPNLDVQVTSNRGLVDIIEGEISHTQTEKTDVNGQAQFKLASYTPGEAVFSILADSLVQLDPVDVKFDPLPFPAYITVLITNPFTHRNITLFAPKVPQEYSANRQLVNTGTKITIPFWIFILFALIILLSPIFIVLNYLNLRKIRKMEAEILEHEKNSP